MAHHLLHHLLVVLGVLLDRLKPWYLCQGKFAAILLLNLPLGVTSEGPRLIKNISYLLSDYTILEEHTSPDRHSHQYVV